MIKLNLKIHLIYLKLFKKKIKKLKLFFLIGADNLEKFHKWKNGKKYQNLQK